MSIGDISLLDRRDDLIGVDACIHGTNLRVEIIADRFVAGERVEDIADDYCVAVDAVVQALRLVLYARGTSLLARRAAEKVERVLPLERPRSQA